MGMKRPQKRTSCRGPHNGAAGEMSGYRRKYILSLLHSGLECCIWGKCPFVFSIDVDLV